MKIILSFILLFLINVMVYSQTPLPYIELKSAPNLTLTADSTQIFYQEPGLYSRTYKYSFVNNSATDTLIVKIKEGNRILWHRVLPGTTLNRNDIYWVKGVIFYAYFASGGITGNKITGEIFEHS